MDTEALTCGHCHKPLDPSGASLYFCPATIPHGDSACQTAWWDAQPKDPRMFTRFGYEEFAGYVPSDVAEVRDAEHRRLAWT